MANGSGTQWGRQRQRPAGKQVRSKHPGTHHRRMQLPQLAQDMECIVTAATEKGRKQDSSYGVLVFPATMQGIWV